MPNILRLTDRKTGASHEGRGLIEVDEKLCAALGVPVDPVHFHRGWVDWIGLYVTNDWSKVRDGYRDEPDRAPILDWLEANYTLDGYAMIGRR